MGYLQTLGSRLAQGFGFGTAGTRASGPQQASAGSTGSESAQTVNVENALTSSAVWACVKLKSESVGSLPIKGYKIDSKGNRTYAPEHPLSLLFSGKANKLQTTQEFLETMNFDEEFHGNAYAAITMVGTRIVSLLPLPADQMEVHLDANGDLTYRYRQDGLLVVLAPASVWHWKGFGSGVTGLSALVYGRESIGLGMAADRRAAKYARNGFKGSAVLSIDKVLKPEQREAIKIEFSNMIQSNDDVLRVLESGMTYENISMSPADTQLLDSRKFQITDICRYFGVPPILIGHSDGATAWGSGVEQIVDGFYRLSLRAKLERIESSINCNLLSAAERGRYEFEFDTASLTRLSPTARAAQIKEFVLTGIVSPNEARVMQGIEKSTDPNADYLYMQSQMTRIGTAPLSAPAFSKPVAIP